MEKEEKIFEVEGTAFKIDIENRSLIEVANKDNVIYFDDMAYEGTHYEMKYNPQDKNIPMSADTEHIKILVPCMVELDPEGMAAKYDKQVSEVSGKTDFEVIVDQEALQARRGGMLPVIDIGGHPFYVDVRLDLLRPKDDFLSPGISLLELDLMQFPGEENYRFLYDPKKHMLAPEPDYDKLTVLPKDILAIEIPHESVLDPVAFARVHNIDETRLLMEHGIRKEHTAKAIDWKDTAIPQTIERNLKASKQNVDEQPQQKKRRGKRL